MVKLNIKILSHKMKRFRRKRRAISPIIATLFIIGLVTTGLVIGIFQIIPFIERSRIESGLTAVETGMISVDSAITNLILSGGGTELVNFDKPLGILSLLPDQDNFHYRFSVGGAPVYSNTTTLGKLQLSTPINYDIIPVNSYKHLNGPNPTAPRSDYVLVDQTNNQGSEFNDITTLNMTRDSSSLFINLYYRPKIVVSQVGPDVFVQIIQVKLKHSTDITEPIKLAVENNQHQLQISYQPSLTLTTTLTNAIAAGETVQIEYQNTGLLPQPGSSWSSIWTSSSNPSAGTFTLEMITHLVEIDVIS